MDDKYNMRCYLQIKHKDEQEHLKAIEKLQHDIEGAAGQLRWMIDNYDARPEYLRNAARVALDCLTGGPKVEYAGVKSCE